MEYSESTCTRCEQTLPTSEFPLRRTTGKPQSWCKKCKNAYDREAYRSGTGQGNDRRKKIAERSTEAKKRARAWVLEYLRSHPCVDCGESDIVVLEFDHLRDKKHNIARLIAGGSLVTLEEEVMKCEVRCCNCHRRITSRRNGSWRCNILDECDGSTEGSGPSRRRS